MPASSSILPARRLTQLWSRLRAVAVAALVVAVPLALVPAGQADAAALRVRRAGHIALNQIGDPYRYGAAGPNAFDCSGLLYFSFRKAGFSNMPRTSSSQAAFAHRIRKSALRRGDLMFFTSGGKVYHAAIFLGRRDGHIVMLHSPHSGSHVRRSRPWTSSWFAATLRR